VLSKGGQDAAIIRTIPMVHQLSAGRLCRLRDWMSPEESASDSSGLLGGRPLWRDVAVIRRLNDN